MPTSHTIDTPAREKAEAWIAELSQTTSRLETQLATLSGFFDGDLGAAIVGAMGISAGEIRQQLPPLRQALRDLDLETELPERAEEG